MRLAVFLVVMGCVHQVDQILLGAEMRVDVQVIVDVIAVVGAFIVHENRRQPDGDFVRLRLRIFLLREQKSRWLFRLVGPR